MKKNSISVLFGLMIMFISQVVLGQSTITFNEITTPVENSLNGTGTYDNSGFRFSIIPGTNPNAMVSSTINGFNNTRALDDNNQDIGGVSGWRIRKVDGSDFQLISLWLQEGCNCSSVSGTIKAYKDGSQVGATVNLTFNSRTNGDIVFSSNPDFYSVDEIRIEATDVFLYIDNFRHGVPISVSDEAPPVVTGISVVGAPFSTATSVDFTVNFSKNAKNVSTDDFQLTTAGTIGTISSVTGSGSSYTVRVNGLDGDGTIRLDLKAGTNITNVDDVAGTPAYTSGQMHYVGSCYTESFENKPDGATNFSSNGRTFILGAGLEVENRTGFGAGPSNRYVKNNFLPGTFTMMADDKFTVGSVDLFLSSQANGDLPTGTGTLTIVGKLGGAVQFTITKNSGFPTTTTVNNGFFTINFATEGGTNNSNKNIDELVFTIGGGFKELAIDNFNFCKAIPEVDNQAPAIQSLTVMGTPESTAGTVNYQAIFNEGAFNVSLDDFSLHTTGTASGMLTWITGSGTTYTLQVTGISGEGTIQVRMKSGTNITDLLGNTPPFEYVNGQLHYVGACYLETFESLANGVTNFVSNGKNFSLGGNWRVHRQNGFGINTSNAFLLNTGSGPFAIHANDMPVMFNQLALFLSSDPTGATPTNNGTLTIRGKNAGNTVYVITKNTGFPTGLGTTNGFFFINFATDGADDYSEVFVDGLEIEMSGGFIYLALDNLGYCIDFEAPSGYTIAIDEDPITPDNETTINFTFAGAEVGTTYHYTFSSTGGGTNVTGSGTISSATAQVTGIDLSGLNPGTVTLSVTLTDASGNQGTIVTDEVEKIINYAPTDITLSNTSINQSGGANAEVGTLSSTDPDGDVTFTYSLASGTGSPDNASFNISGAILRANHASTMAAGDYSVRIQTDDENGGTFQKAFTISVVDDVPPTVSGVSVPANATYVAGQNLDFTVNVSENVTVTGTPQLPLTIGSTTVNAAYIAGGSTATTLFFRYTIIAGQGDPDGIAVSSSINLNGGTITDGANLPLTLTLNSIGNTTSIFVDAVAPSITSVDVPAAGIYGIGQPLEFTVNFDEAVKVNSGIPRIPMTIGSTTRYATYATGSETSALTFTYTIASGDEDTDGISLGAGIDLNGGALPDLAGNAATLILNSVGSTNSVRVDGIAPTASTFSPTNGASNMRPDDNLVITFSENMALGTGNIVIYNTTNTPVATINVGSHSSQLSINGNVLTINPTVNLLELNEYYVHIGNDAIRDLAGNTYAGINNSTTWTFTVADITAPMGYAVSIDQATILLSNHTAFSFTFSAAEVGATFNYIITSSGGGTPVTGSGTVSSAGQQLAGIDVSGLANGTLTLSVTLTDPSDNEGDPVTDNVTKAVNYAPTVTTSGGSTPFIESVSSTPVPVRIDDALGISDPDNTMLASATVTVTGNFQNGQDILALVSNGSTMGNITGSYAGNILTLTSAGATATVAQWQVALRSVTYSNISQNPITSDRTISFIVNDGIDVSTPATKTVTVQAVNTAPVVTVPASIAVVEDVATALTGISFADADAGTGSVNVTISVLSGTLDASAGAGVTVGGSSNALILSGSISDINAFIASNNVTYTPSANNTGNVTLTVLINDNGNSGSGGNQSHTEITILQIAAVNDAPIITAPPTLTVTEDVAGPLTGISFTDVDAGNGNVIVTLSVPIGTLTASTGGGVTVGGTSSAMTLTGTIANINAFIAASNATYTTALNATANVILTVTIDDNGNTGAGGSKSANLTITLLVTAVNDAPVINNLGGDAVTFTEDGPAILLDAGSDATVEDPDSPDFNGGSLTIAVIANGVTGEDQLAIRNDGSGVGQISVLGNDVFYSGIHLGIKTGGTGGTDLIVTFGPTATPAAVQALIRNLTYSNSNTVNPSVAPRTIRITLNDGDGATSLPSDVTVNITAVNDAPVVTTSGGVTTFTESVDGDPVPEVIDPGLTVVDPDNTTLASATVSITGNHQAGQDILVFTNEGSTMGNIDSSYDEATGTLTLTSSGSSATLAEWQAALRAVKYSNSSQNPNTTNRTISFSVNDGSTNSSPATKDVAVVAVNTAPVAVDDPITLNEDIPATGNVLTNDSDVEGNTLLASLVTAPVNGTVVLNTDGSFTYTPNSNYNGLDSLKYQVCDNGTPSRCDMAWIRFTIVAVNDAPTITGTPATSVDQDAAYSFVPTGNDIDGDNLTFSIVNKPDWATFNATTGELHGTPGNDDVGTTTGIVITVSDGTVSVSLPAFNLEVVNVNDAPTIWGTPATTVDQDEAYSFVPAAMDVDIDDVLTFSIVNKPDWAIFDTTTGELYGTPGNDDVGTTTGIIITVSDGLESVSLSPFNIEVVNVNDAPKITGTPATSLDHSTAYSFVPTASDIDIGDVLQFSIVNKPAWADFDPATGTLSGTPRNVDVGVTTGIIITVSDGTLQASLPAFDLEVKSTIITGVTLSPGTFVYNGTTRSLEIQGSLPVDATVTYLNNSHINVGNQTVTAIIEGIGYIRLELTAELRITPAVITGVTLADAQFVYNGTTHSLAISGQLPAGTNVTYVGNGRINVGVQTVTAVVSGSNYQSLELSAALRVVKATQTLTLQAPARVTRDAGKITLEVSSSSGLPVTLQVDDPLVASVTDQSLHIHRLGVVKITASQNGDDNHLAASPVTITVEVVRGADDPGPGPDTDLNLRVHPAVSPNGDGINDFLIIEGVKEYPNNRVTIFNRNGTILWEGDQYNNGSVRFNGYDSKGKRLTAGTYFYILEAKDAGKLKYHKGFFVLQ